MTKDISGKHYFPQVTIVEASAGSGKTRALSSRYLELLFEGSSGASPIFLKNVLAITFSNKAMFEMKERILDFLKKIALDRFRDVEEKDAILEALDMDPAQARIRARSLMEELIRNYNYFQVRTIDSFINAILSGCAFKLNLSAAFRIKTDYSDYLSYSLDRLVDRAARDVKIHSLLRDFLRQYLIVEDKKGWFPKKAMLEGVKALFVETNRYGGVFAPVPGEPQDLAVLKKKIFGDMDSLLSLLPQGTDARFSNSLTRFLDESSEGFDLGSVSDYFKRDVFPVNKGHKIPGRIETLWKKIKNGLVKISELESVIIFGPSVGIFNLVLDEFRRLASKEDVLFLEELNRQARALFGEEMVTVPELYYRLAGRLSHFLIDEFQDTSLLQWQNLYPMVKEALATDGSLFYVGDKKQAIYRFRGGEVGLFDHVEGLFRDLSPIKKHLSCNFRSRKAIVEFCNLIFSQENLERFLETRSEGLKSKDGILGVFKGATQTWKTDKQDGYVKVERVPCKNKDERNSALKEKILAVISELKEGRGFAYKDIALLARQNDDVEFLTGCLVFRGIPVESEKTLNIRNNSLIKELISFLKFLNSPIDNLSFASFILGDIFSKAAQTDSREFRDFIFGLKKKMGEDIKVNFYREFQRAFPELWESFFKDLFKDVGFLPLYELSVSILTKFNILASFGDRQGFFMKFLELIKDKEEEKAGLAAFLDFFKVAKDEELYVSVSESDAVKVLTIHKAKGLEFPVVIVPFLEMDAGVDKAMTYGVEAGLMRRLLTKKYCRFSERISDLYAEEYERSMIDELDNIYVALTRPIQELYCFIPEKAKKGPNPANRLIPEGIAEMGKKEKPTLERMTQESHPPLEIPLPEYKDWLGLLKDEFIDEGVLLRQEIVLRGEVLHTVLSFIGDLSRQAAGQVLKEAIRKTKFLYPFFKEWSEAEGVVKKLILDERFRPFFFLGEGSVAQEKEVVDALGRTYRIDRLVIKEDEAWVLDYKSSRQEKEADHVQVKAYMSLVRSLFTSKTIRGFLAYLDELDIEEVHG